MTIKKSRCYGENMEKVKKEDRKRESNLLLSEYLSEEQQQAIGRIKPMTQYVFNSIMQTCMENGEVLEEFMFKMMKAYPEYLAVYAREISDEVS